MGPVGPGVHEPRAEAFLPLTTCFLIWEQNRTLSSAGATDSTAEAAGPRPPRGACSVHSQHLLVGEPSGGKGALQSASRGQRTEDRQWAQPRGQEGFERG